MKLSSTILALGCVASVAQPALVTTNAAPVPDSFRIVNGQLYHTEKSVLFSNLAGQCVAILSNGVVIQQMAIRRVYTNVNVEPPELAHALGLKPAKRLISEELVPGKKLFIRNYPNQPPAKVGTTITARAMRDGTYHYETEPLELWDCGTPRQVLVVKTNLSTNAPNPNAPNPGMAKP